MDRPHVPPAEVSQWKTVYNAFRSLHRDSRTYIVISWMLTGIVVILDVFHPSRPLLLYQPNSWDELSTLARLLAAISWVLIVALLALSVNILWAKVSLLAPHDTQIQLIASAAILLDVIGLCGGVVSLVIQFIIAGRFREDRFLEVVIFLALAFGAAVVQLFAIGCTTMYVGKCGRLLASSELNETDLQRTGSGLQQALRQLASTIVSSLSTAGLAFVLILVPTILLVFVLGIAPLLFVIIIIPIFLLKFSQAYLTFLDDTRRELERLGGSATRDGRLV